MRVIIRSAGRWLILFALATTCGFASRLESQEKKAPAKPSNRDSAFGINLSGVVDYSPEMAFLDLFKQSRAWVSQEEGKSWGQGPELDLTPEGWIKRFKPKQFATTLLCVAGGQTPGRYVCLYDGEGTFRFQGAAKVTGQKSGRLELDISDQENILLNLLKTNPRNPVRNIRVLRLKDVRAAKNLAPFSSTFLDRYRPFKVLRFMDWMKTNNSGIRSWSDRPKPEDATQTTKGVALEYMIALCNELKADPWFCVPHLADDDYVRNFSIQVRKELDPSLKIYIEHSNEVWNGSFEQAKYALKRGQELRLSTNPHQSRLFYHAKRSVEIFKIWDQVFAEESRQRLVRVLASQSVNPWVSEQVMGYQDAAKHADALAIAPYFGNSLGDPKTAGRVAEMSLEQLFKACARQVEEGDKFVAMQAKAARDRGLSLIAYEGGQHLVGYQGAENNQALMELFHKANRDPRMGDLYRQHLAGWKKSGGRLYVVFSGMSKPSKWGSWGLLETERQDPNKVPKYRAVFDFMRNNPRWWR